MKKKWKVILCIALAAVVLGGSLTAWLLYTPPDTDPDAPFKDLSNWEKRRILVAVEEYWENTTPPGMSYIFWYGDLLPWETELSSANYSYGVKYYGTFGGYHIILSPQATAISNGKHRNTWIAGYTFFYSGYSALLAYKNGKAIPLEDAYLNPLSKEQIQQIHQCYERYNQEVYRRKAWEENEKNQRNQRVICALYVCGAVVVLAGMGFGIFRVCRNYRKQRSKGLQ